MRDIMYVQKAILQTCSASSREAISFNLLWIILKGKMFYFHNMKLFQTQIKTK